MRYCAFCGKEMDDSAKFCANCGKSVATVMNGVNNDKTYVEQKKGMAISVLKSLNKVMLITTIIIVVLQALAIFYKAPQSFAFPYGKLDSKAVYALVFTLCSVAFFCQRENYGIVSLVCAIISCILISALINSFLYEFFIDGETYSYIKACLIEADIYFGFAVLKSTRVILIIITSLNVAVHVATTWLIKNDNNKSMTA